MAAQPSSRFDGSRSDDGVATGGSDDDLRVEVDEASSAAAAIGRVAGPVLAAAAMLCTHPAALALGGLGADASWTLGVLVLMAVWWVTLAVEPAVTGLIPFVAFAALGIGKPAEIAAPYANQVMFLFAGGALIGLSLERTGVSARLATAVVGVAGTTPLRVLAAIMATTAILSAFVSNLATAATMLPLVTALGARALDGARSDAERASAGRFLTSLLLGVAFAASIGGALTIIGSPPNPIAVQAIRESGEQMTFVGWMAFSIPATAALLPIAVLVLGAWLFPARGLAIARIEVERKPLGRDGWAAVAVFLLAVALWVTNPLYAARFPAVGEGTIAVAAALLLFMIPSALRPGARILAPSAFSRIPWRVLVLFGGGLCLADAMQRTGLSSTIGEVFAGAGALPSIALLLILVAALVFASEVASNTTLTAMAMPIICAMAPTLGVEVKTLAIPAAFAASWAFAMPVGTPPNALVYGTGRLRAQDMMRAGVILDLVAIVVIVVMATVLL
jgi:sodium-dependent dicarboxylate transporter 2/3/5